MDLAPNQLSVWKYSLVTALANYQMWMKPSDELLILDTTIQMTPLEQYFFRYVIPYTSNGIK